MTQIRARTPAPAGVGLRQADGPRPRLEPRSSVRLTGRGAVALLFALCFGTQLIAAWTGWGTLAGAAFVCGCGAVTYYTRTGGLRAVVVAPPLLFFAGSACAQLITAPGTLVAAERILVVLGTSAPWLFTGTALTTVVAVGRGYRPSFMPGTRPEGSARRRWLGRR
jgi:Domain of unknown function (DUF6542)